jgi:hypothetical protein
MKPYKIIKSKNPCLKRKKLVGKLKPPKVPLRLFKNVHPPKRIEITYKGKKMEIAPGEVSLDDQSMTDEEIIEALPAQKRDSFYRHQDP